MGRTPATPGFAIMEGPMPASMLAYYYKTPVWIAKRAAMLHFTGGKCQRCFAPAKTVFHKHYRTLGHESFDDLEVLCSRCRH